MAKRFVDTDKYKKEWFRRLPCRLKCAWEFLCLNCDHAGVWPISLASLEFHVGEAVTLQELIDNFEIVVIDDKLFIPSFIEFQYGCSHEELNASNKVHLSVLHILKKMGLPKGLPSPLQAPKDKEKEKDMDKEKEKEKEIEKNLIKPLATPIYVPSAPRIKPFSSAQNSDAEWNEETPEKIREIMNAVFKNKIDSLNSGCEKPGEP